MYEKSIELLNRAVGDELAAVHQYMYFHFHLADQGYDQLSALFRRTAIQEMRHVEPLAARVLSLKGEVALKASGEVSQVQDVAAALEMGRKMEEDTIRDYTLWADECAAAADPASKKIFKQLVAKEKVHYDQFECELASFHQVGDRHPAL